MKSLKILALTGALVAVFALAGCESHSSSSTSVEVSTSTESGTKTYSSSTQTKDGVTTSTETTVETKNSAATSAETAAETPAASGQQDEFYTFDYHVEDSDGTLTLTLPYSAEKWWKCVGDTNKIEVVEEYVVDDIKSVSTVKSTVDEGPAKVVMAHFEPNSEEPVEYMLIDVNIVGGKIDTVQPDTASVVKDLAEASN